MQISKTSRQAPENACDEAESGFGARMIRIDLYTPYSMV